MTRTNSILKKKASKIFNSHGLNMSSAFNMYLNDIVEGRTKPSLDVKYVNDKTMEVWENQKKESLKDGQYFNSVSDFMRELEK
jgi:addiction module RelB/DinJ family antitoxin